MYIIHGNDTVASRNRLQQLILEAKSIHKEIIKLNGKKISLTEIKQSLESQSLFDQVKLTVVENLFSRQQSKEKQSILKYIKTSPSNLESIQLILWESKQLTPFQLKGFPSQSIQQFKLPFSIFQLLDSFSPNQSALNLKLFHNALENQPLEMVFGMIIKRLRYLIVGKTGGQALSEFKELRDWQSRKIYQQANKFTTKQLLQLNENFLEIDYKRKTGQTTLDLQRQLELLLTNL